MCPDHGAYTCAILQLESDIGRLQVQQGLAEACHEFGIKQAMVENFVAVVLVKVFPCFEDLLLEVHDFLGLGVLFLIAVVFVHFPVFFLMLLTAIVCFLAVVARVVGVLATNLARNDFILTDRTCWNV
jgi:hypothetical protein